MTNADNLMARLPRDRFWRLPEPAGTDGRARCTGVEIEFSGVTEEDAAGIVRDLWGGRITKTSPHQLSVDETAIGTIEIELDTAFKDKADAPVAGKLLDLSRSVVPVEIVSPPIPFDDLPEMDRLMAALKDRGALGSEDGVLLAFGIHLNPEVAAETAEAIVPIARAFACLEPWLRAADTPDLSRRILPFIEPWPREFVDQIAAHGGEWGLGDLCDAYLELVPSRNHGLDLLPLLEHLFPDRVRDALPEDQLKGGRPTWHYRLPETALGDEGWSFAYEWNRWILVERVAADGELLERLAEAWQAHRSRLSIMRSDWTDDVRDLVGDAAIWHD